MRISNNSLKAILEYYHRELDALQGPDESKAIFETAAEHYLSVPRHFLATNLDQRLQHSEILELYDCAKAVKSGRPIQHVLGETWFLNLRLKVNNKVLIPRPETEELCDLIIRENINAKRILDIGTGSACIPIALKKNISEAEVYTCDICAEALDTALENALRNETEIHFLKADVLDAEFPSHFQDTFDVMVSNPPYILRSEASVMEKQVLEQEPHLALFVEGQDPILFYRHIISHSGKLLKSGGKLYFELNPFTAKEVDELARKSNLFSEIQLIKDLSGKVRFFKAVKL